MYIFNNMSGINYARFQGFCSLLFNMRQSSIMKSKALSFYTGHVTLKRRIIRPFLLVVVRLN